MKMSKFKMLRVINNDNTSELKVGDCFLEGESIIEQSGLRNVGEVVTYYKVTSKNGNNIAYSPCYEKLEEG